jgi:hypothetical protein
MTIGKRLRQKRRSEDETAEKIPVRQIFYEAMEEVQATLNNGKAEWYSFCEVFPDE